MNLKLRAILFFQVIGLLYAASAWADDAIKDNMLMLTHEDAAVRKAAIMGLAKTGDIRLERFFDDYRMGSLYIWNDNVVLSEETVEDDDLNELLLLSDPLTREPIIDGGKQVAVPVEDLTEVSSDRQERRLASKAKFFLRLSSPDPGMRLSGAKKSGDPPWIVEPLDRLKEMSEKDPDNKIRYVASESLHLIRLSGAIPDQKLDERLSAARVLGDMKSMRALPLLQELLADIIKLEEADPSKQPSTRPPYVWKAMPISKRIDGPKVTRTASTVGDGGPGELSAKQVYQQAIERIKGHQNFVGRLGNVFQGLSLGSILILMALGLAITFGLMGVINMAHGELMMIGAYATFEMQRLFGHTPENPQDLYYVIALPAAFLSAAFVGYLIEALVVRHLYRRPLESLLATWGVGLLLIQIVRLRYGDNIGVNAPTWARGGIEIMQDVILPYGRLFIIALCGLSVVLIYYLIKRTKMGLRMRATMQSRDMANSLGVNIQRVDRFTFAFGSGIAGIAGYSWTLIGGVTPDMGQTNFIVDSFLVVVTGGVGELLGVIFSGLGIGVLNKVAEPTQIGSFVVGAIWAKVMLLIGIVMFIQFKPAGLFSPKGRLADE